MAIRPCGPCGARYSALAFRRLPTDASVRGSEAGETVLRNIVRGKITPLEGKTLFTAFNRRRPWVRKLHTRAPYLKQIARMVEVFGELGVLERRAGVDADSNFPPRMYVETLGGEPAPEAEPG